MRKLWKVEIYDQYIGHQEYYVYTVEGLREALIDLQVDYSPAELDAMCECFDTGKVGWKVGDISGTVFKEEIKVWG